MADATATSAHGAPELQGPRARRSRRGSPQARRSRGPIDPRLLRRASATRWYLAAAVAVGCATAALTLVQAWVLAHAIAAIFGGDWTPLAGAVGVLAAVFAAKAALSWLNDTLAQRASASVKSQLRADILAARLARPLDSGATGGGLITLVTQGLDALDGFYSKYLPQLMLAVTVPVIVGVAILTADLTSAIIVALTLPLIPVFMALVGWTTEARTRKRWRVQTRLAHHFSDLVAGLPTLQVFGRARAQAEGLRRTEAAHRAETMATLRISFLSALVLELLATLSVALVAVTVGFRVVFGDLDLGTALFVLILAPEAYLPVRQVGVHYHDAADGMAAAESAFALIDAGVREGSGTDAAAGAPADAPADAARPGPAASGLVARVSDLGHTYPGASEPAVAGVSFDVRPGEFVALTGPSGGGKTTVLNALLGFLTPTRGTADLDAARVAYVGQNPGMVRGDIAANVRLGDPDARDDRVRDALDRAGGPDLDPARGVGDDGEGLSAGERRRVATARALLRIDAGGADVLVLDEPTAGLDADAEAALLAGVRALGVAAIVVSHRPAVIGAADQVVEIGVRSGEGDAS
ncbi:thiol reductant ABC exporter subunit CydD [Nigerium sp.]|uniref:thiol reductant ABC exporter subunit CydD n=1 Tax=Nigerium sp. TaxID=2042655 RepID=UPI003221B333